MAGPLNNLINYLSESEGGFNTPEGREMTREWEEYEKKNPGVFSRFPSRDQVLNALSPSSIVQQTDLGNYYYGDIIPSSAEPDKGSGTYNHVSLFLKSLLGERSPITEKNLTPAQLNALAKITETAKGNRAKERLDAFRGTEAGAWLVENARGHPNTPSRFEATPPDWEMRTVSRLRDDLPELIKMRDRDAKKSQKKDSIQYSDYPEYVGENLNEAGWRKNIELLNDPYWQLAHMFGRSMLDTSPEGKTQVVDKYNFKSMQTKLNEFARDAFFKDEKEMYKKLATKDADSPSHVIRDFFMSLDTPRALGNLVGRRLVPETEGRDVRVTLPSMIEKVAGDE